MMFKILCAAILAGIMTVNLSGAELKVYKNRIQSGNSTIYLDGSLSVINQKQKLLSIYPHFTTKGKTKWYSFVNKQASPKLLFMENNSWKFQAGIPLNAESALLKVIENITVTPSNTIEAEISWEKPAQPSDLVESACFFSLPLQKDEKDLILVNGTELPLANETKFGWFSEQMDNPVFVLYPGVEGKELTLTFHGSFNKFS